MLNIDPVAVSQAYGRVVSTTAASRTIELKPIYGGNRSSGYSAQDQVDVSQEGQEFSNFLANENKKQQQAELQHLITLSPQEQQLSQRYDQARAQILSFLMAQGLSASQAMPQAEKIIARMGYQRHQGYGQGSGQDAESFEGELKKATNRQKTAAMTVIAPISGINILA